MPFVEWVAGIRTSSSSEDAEYFTIALVAAVLGLIVLIFTRTKTRPSSKQIRPLATGRGLCIKSDRITVSGNRVGYMLGCITSQVENPRERCVPTSCPIANPRRE
jgi:hypothetical protein